MWTDTHLVEGDMEARVDLQARMDSRLREAEQWRLARGTRNAKQSRGMLAKSLDNLIARIKPWLEGTPQPQEECC